MNQDVFFKNFELLADAPNGVQKLRELILQLAVMGKLVPQDPNDEPASILLEKIAREKKVKKPLTVVNSEKISYSLPNSWEWSTIGDFAIVTMGQSPESEYYNKEERGLPFYQGKSDFGKIHPTPKNWCEKPKKNAEKGDILISVRAPVGPTNICPEKSCIGRGLASIKCITGSSNYYVLYTLRAFEGKIASLGVGSTFSAISKTHLNDFLIPIPPEKEQKRIVAKVDELMVFCDKLEVRRQKKQDLQSKLNSAALERMLIAENQEEFEQYWQRICENFDLLYDNLENVEKLRQAILQLAVQGKLVPQNPEDEPANVLIEKIEAEKRQLDKEGKIQKTKKLQSVDIEEIPYCVPDGWMWTRFGNIAPYIEAGWSPMCEKRPKEGDEWGILKISAVSWNTFNPSENKALPSNLKPRPEYEVKLNDFLMSRANTSGLVGKSVIVEKIIPKLMICDKVLRLFFSSFVSKKFYNIFNNSQTARFYYAKEASGTSSSMKNISREVIYNMPVPLPPLAEQKRIVEKVEQLMGLCDELESKLRKSRKDSEKLMEAVVKGLLEGAAAEKRELEKPIPLQVASIQLK